VAELETQILDDKLEIDSLKASPVVSDKVDCVDCSVFLADLTALREKHASKCEELNVLRVELAELQSRPTLLGACTSYPALNEKIDEFRCRIVSLEADLKVHVPTSCCTCELHAVKNLELGQCVDRLQTENDDLRNLLSWLSSQEPQLGMMIEALKRFDGQALGSDKVGECSGEREGKFEKTPVPPHTTPKNQFAPKPNQMHEPREKPSEKPIVQGRKHEKKPQPTSKAKPVRFHCEHCGRDGHKREFCFKRRREERLAREMANKDMYRPSRGVPEPRVVPRSEGVVHTVPSWRDQGFPTRGAQSFRFGVGVMISLVPLVVV
jgi:hypothetical protein